jgi:hypothetical protein
VPSTTGDQLDALPDLLPNACVRTRSESCSRRWGAYACPPQFGFLPHGLVARLDANDYRPAAGYPRVPCPGRLRARG